MMTNDELGQAIVATQDRLRLVGTAYAEHPILVEHLKALLAEQLKRATEGTEPSGMEIAQREADEAAAEADPRDRVWGSTKETTGERLCKPLCAHGKHAWERCEACEMDGGTGFTNDRGEKR